MADDFDLGLVLRADGSQAISEGDAFADSLDRVAASTKRADNASREQATGTSAGSRATKEATAATQQQGAALDRLASELDEARAAAAAAAASNSVLAAAQARAVSASAALAVAHDKVAAAATQDAAAQTRAAAAVAAAEARVAAAAVAVERATRGSTVAHNDNASAVARNAFGLRNLGQQIGDFATQVSLGGGVAQAFAAQAGQAGFALSEMGGAAGKVGAFLVGPWGIALTVASVALAPLIGKLAESVSGAGDLTDALGKAGFATSAFKDAQGILGGVLDLTTGKINTQSSALLGLARAQALAGQIQSRARAAEARSDLTKGANAYGGSAVQALAGKGLSSTSFVGGLAPTTNRNMLSPSAAVATDVLAGNLDTNTAIKRLDALLDKGKITEQQFLDLGKTITTLGVENENLGVYKNLEKALDGDTKAVKGFLNETKAKKPKKAPKPKSTEAVDEFGRDAADTIGGILAQFDGTPTLVRQINTQVAKLDDLIDDLGRKKPPNFKELIASAQQAKAAVQNSINKPYADFIADQERSIENTRLVAAGRADEAQAAQIVYGLEKQMGPLSQARKDAILATVQAMKAEERQADILREKQEKYLTALGSIKAAVKGVITDGLGGIEDLPKRLIGAFSQLRSDEIFESLFGDVFRELEDQVKGTSVVEDASSRMSEAINGTLDPLGDLAAAATKTASALAGSGNGPSVVDPSKGLAGTVASVASSAGGGDVAGAVAALLAGQTVGGLGVPSLPGGAANDNAAGGDIVVTGRKGQSALKLFSGSLEKIAKGVGISDEGAKKIGTIGGKAIAGAAEGAAINSVLKPIGKALGFKTSKTGAEIGGAIGSFVPIPFGKEIGAVVGSIIGGLFKKTKTGSATIGNVGGEGVVTGTSGNTSSYKKAASGLADAVVGSLDSVVDALGGTLGDFAVSIGKRSKKFVVDPTGSGKTKGGSTTKYDTEEEAEAAALANAIADGAVKGISAAMQRALQSTTDVDKAVAEALKVKTVEDLIASVGDKLKQTFSEFDKTAAEYVTIAKKYGVDVVAVEKATAQQRADLIASTLKNEIGSLSDFLDNLKYGDLAEGSPVDQRKKLLDKITSVQTDAEAGKDGAADQLAQLYQQLLTQDKNDFGTAGSEYAGDRAAAQAGVQKVIDMATQRVNDAASSSADTVAAINQGNALADENNALTAQLVAGVNGLPSSLAAAILGGSYGNAANLNAVARAAVA